MRIQILSTTYDDGNYWMWPSILVLMKKYEDRGGFYRPGHVTSLPVDVCRYKYHSTIVDIRINTQKEGLKERWLSSVFWLCGAGAQLTITGVLLSPPFMRMSLNHSTTDLINIIILRGLNKRARSSEREVKILIFLIIA